MPLSPAFLQSIALWKCVRIAGWGLKGPGTVRNMCWTVAIKIAYCIITKTTVPQ